MRRLLLLSLVALATARYVGDIREKRDVEYHEWLTDSQKAELKALKESANAAELKKRTMELYELLPADQKEKWNGKYKEMCVAWIKETATEEEHANYKKWKEEGKMDEIKAQYTKIKGRLTEEKRKDVELWESECWTLWKDEFPASRGRRSIEDLAKEKLSFLGDEKIAELKALKDSGASDDVIRDKVVTWTLEHWKSKDSKVSTGDFVKKCYGWIKDVTQAEEYEAFEKLHHTDHEACRVKVREFLARLPLDKQAQVEKSLPLCDAIWYKQHQEEHGAHAGHDEHHSAHKHHGKRHLNTMHIEKFMTWLTKEQKEIIEKLEAGGEKYEDLIAKMKGWYDELEADKKKTVREDIKEKCAEWVYAKTTETEQYELKDLVLNGDKEGFIQGLKKPYSKLTEEEQHEVDHTKDLCIAVWTTEPSRRRRDHHHNHEEYKEYFSWLTEEQGAEVKKLRDAGDQEGVYNKMYEYYDALAGEKKTEATEKLKGACKKFFKATFGEEAVEEVKAMKESGVSMDEIANKVAEFIGKITDEKKKAVATRASNNCKKIFSASRKRREHGDKHEEYKEYFTWLTPEQGAELKQLRDAGKEDEAYAKTLEFHSALEGDKKTDATEKLKGACKKFFSGAFGDAALEEIKALKESGSSMDVIADKVAEFIGKITDEKKKAAATRVSANCKKIFSASRKRRDNAYEAYKQYFTWLTPEQAAEVKALKDGGDEEAANKKVHEYYDALAGDKKTEATEKLKGACRHFFKDTFGDAAVEEFKALKEAGTSVDEIAKKVDDLIAKIGDEKKKTVATRASGNCKKLFGAASRKRRDHHEEYKQYFAWLSPEQGAEVKALKDSGADEETIEKKIHEFFVALAGDKKSEATEQLKGACRHYFKDTLGEAAVAEFKALKEAGTPVDEISKKVEEMIGKISDDKKKAKAAKAAGQCKKLFVASRKRRDHHHEHEEYKQYFAWLTPEQGTEIKALKESGADEETIEKKIHDFFAALTGDKKTEATEQLKGACRHFFKDTLGEAAVAEFKALKEAGTSVDEVSKKVEELISKITDEKKKAKAAKAAGNCKKLFIASSASRKRRDHKHSMDEMLTDYLPWLTDAQKAELKTLKEAGDDAKVGEKIMEFYGSVDASKKEEATSKLQAGCRHFLKGLIGDAAAEEMKALKETGASNADMAKQLDAIIAKMPEGSDKKKAEGITKNCKVVYGVASRKRRDHKHTVDEAITEFLPWLTDAQKGELKALKESGAEEQIGGKIMEFYESVDASKKEEAKMKLQAGCKHFLGHYIGAAASEEMKALKESGASPADMTKKLEEIIAAMPEGADKKKAEGMTKNCKKVYGVASRKRRHEHTLEEGFTEFLPWITEEQKMELKNMKEAGAQAKIGDKVMEYYESVDASKKDEARTKLQAGCRHYLKHLLGDTVSGEMKAMHESGSSPAEMAKKLDQIIGKMEDGEKKAKAEGLSKNCRKVYGVDARKRRNLYGEYDERYQKYYSWLKDEQKDELAELQDSGESDELLDKVAQYFQDLEEAKKEEARGQLKMGCRMRMRDLLGEEKAEEIRKMKDDGASRGEMMDKVAQFVEEMGEGEEKESARRAYRHCAKILSRQRRQGNVNFADFTRWLKPEQRKELNDIIRSEQISSNEIYGKLFEYLNQLSGTEKYEATQQMKGACKHLLRTFLGDAQGNKLVQMRESGKKWSDVEHTMDQMLAAIEDVNLRTKAQAALGQCKPIWRPTINP